jgi:hypothetical protein
MGLGRRVITVAWEIILGAWVVIGVFIFWCDYADRWKDVRALLPHYLK